MTDIDEKLLKQIYDLAGDIRYEQVYNEVLDNTVKHIDNCNGNGLIVAGVMLTQALSIYKTMLTEDGFDDIVEGIVASKRHVKKFNVPTTTNKTLH
jgi:hypothetical protein